MAFVDLGDQFIALAEGSTQRQDARATSASSSTTATRYSRQPARPGSKIFGGNSFLDPWGNQVQVVAYAEVQFSKTPEVLRGMGLELEKTESALRELRGKGLA